MKLLVLFSFIFSMALTSQAQVLEENGALDELDPFAPNIEQILQNYDDLYESETGQRAFDQQLELLPRFLMAPTRAGCFQMSCDVYAQVVKETQKMYLYLNGQLVQTWAVSTGLKGHTTPNMNTHPNGRIYTKYTSTKYPGGDYMGLGNMPYAVFIQGGFAIHGTAESNWKKLGTPASHGCIRIHPDNAKYFNEIVRQVGVSKVWVSVQ